MQLFPTIAFIWSTNIRYCFVNQSFEKLICFWTRVDQLGVDFFEKADYFKLSFAWVILLFYSEKESVTLTNFDIWLQSIYYEMTLEVFGISTNHYRGCLLLLNSGDGVEFNINSEVLGAIYNDNQK